MRHATLRPVENPASSPAPIEAVLTSLQHALDYPFQNAGLLSLALSLLQPPLTPEAAAARQRLEFLGDAAWNFAVAVAAFRAWPHATAGDLTRLRAAWCSTLGLAQLARQIGVPAPEDLTPVGPSDRVLAEMLEAILGAMVEDGGLAPVRALAQRVLAQQGPGALPPPPDPKSALQMLAQARRCTLPAYTLVERRGPPHHPTFRVRVTVGDQNPCVQAEAEGSNRQAAEQEAARLALERFASLSNPEAPHLVEEPPPGPQR